MAHLRFAEPTVLCNWYEEIKGKKVKKRKEASKGHSPRLFQKMFLLEMSQEIVKQLRSKKSDILSTREKKNEKMKN